MKEKIIYDARTLEQVMEVYNHNFKVINRRLTKQARVNSDLKLGLAVCLAYIIVKEIKERKKSKGE